MTEELQNYAAWLDQARQAVRDVLLGMYGPGLNWRPSAPGTNSIYSLAYHCAWVEDYWISAVIPQQPFIHDWGDDADLKAAGDDPADLLFMLDQAASRSAAVLAQLSAADLATERSRQRRDGSLDVRTVRWCLVHTISHYSEHIGQMELTRQLWEAQGAQA